MVLVLAQVEPTLETGLLILAVSILVGPLIAERLRVPGLVGLILMGVVFGPGMLAWLAAEGLVAVVGSIGLLYLMFMAGLELDLRTFVENRRAAITFGLLTFTIPFVLSLGAATLWVGTSVAGSVLVGAMWASHTVVAYPDVKAAGLGHNRAVALGVSSMVITDVLSLMLLAVATAGVPATGDATAPASAGEHDAVLPLWLGVVLLVAFTIVVLPRLTRWLFAEVAHTRTQRFVVLFAGMSAGAAVGLLGGIEGLVGAFLAGIGMNRMVPVRGGLMEHVEFLGSALLVPAFLVSVGLAIDPRAFLEWDTIRLALLFVVVVVVGKGVAAVVSGRLFGFSAAETGILATLTMGQAAATLAIAQVGVATGLFDADVFNAAILTVVVTVLATSFGSLWFARRVDRDAVEEAAVGRHVLAMAPTRAVGPTMSFAATVAAPDGGLVTPFVIGADGSDPDAHERLEGSVRALTSLGMDSEGTVRVASSETEGIAGLVAEQDASLVVLPWTGPSFLSTVLFGDDIDVIGVEVAVPAVALSAHDRPWERVVVLTGRRAGIAAREEDLALALDLAGRLCPHGPEDLVVVDTEGDHHPDLAEAGALIVDARGSAQFLADLAPTDLVVVPAHVVANGRFVGLGRVARTLASHSVAVVAGPGRLSVGARPGARVHGVVAPSIGADITSPTP